MGFGFKQPLVGEKRCVMTLITAAKETTAEMSVFIFLQFNELLTTASSQIHLHEVKKCSSE